MASRVRCATVWSIPYAARKAARLTQSLLAFSRRQIINPRPVNLNDIVSAVIKMLSRLISEDIELSTTLADNDLTIMADTGQIEQVLMNLATNAKDAMPNGGMLSISTELVELDNGFLKIHVDHLDQRNSSLAVRIFAGNGRLVKTVVKENLSSSSIDIPCDIRRCSRGVYIVSVSINGERNLQKTFLRM